MIPKFVLRSVAAALLGFALSAPAQDVRPVPPPPPPRLQVTGPVETPVELRSVRIASAIEAGVALTTVELAFYNPNGRVLEGELRLPLLAGQSVVGFALDVDGRMREAVPIEKARGQAIFEDITRVRVDPGLLEATEGDNYRIRVYPLPARGERRVLVRYSQGLATRSGFRVLQLPLEYARGVRDFALDISAPGEASPRASSVALGTLRFERAGEGWHASVRRQGAPGGVLEVAVADAPGKVAVAQRFGDAAYFHAEGRVKASTRARKLPRVVQLIWDSSGSMAPRDAAREEALLQAYFSAARDVEVHLVRLRDAAEPVERFSVANGDWSALRRALEATVHDGATNLGAIPPDAEAGERLLFSDGLSNFGERAAPAPMPVYAIASTANAASVALRHMAEASGGRFIDLAAESEAQARERLLNATTRIAALEGEGVTDLISRSTILSDGRIGVAGILTAPRGNVRVTVKHPDGTRETIVLAVAASERTGRLAGTTWAAWKVAALEADPELHRGAIRRLGRAFGLATRETSLIVLERAEDYARHEVEPPAELADAYARLRTQAVAKSQADNRSHVERIVKRFLDKQAWFDRDFPKDTPPPPRAREAKAEGALAQAARPMAAPSSVASAPAPQRLLERREADVMAKTAAEKPAGTTIHLKAWRPDSPYASRMREASGDRVYRVYLDERPDYLRSSAFFLDAADILFEKNQPELAVRVLSNLAEMDLENRHVLRILGYRLVQARRSDLAVPIFRKVLAFAPEEPQSYRDLGLAQGANGRGQEAVDLLSEVVMRPWHGRFPDIELIALAELNAIVATAPAKLDTSRVDPRLLRNLPLDLRVVLTWDADNTDIDLWVTDPNGEKAFYGHQLTYQGGRMSLDFTGGYGPEEFSLKNAKPGTYKIEANFYGHRQQTVAGATTLQVKLITGFGTAKAEEKIVTLRLKGAQEVVHVGDFEVR